MSKPVLHGRDHATDVDPIPGLGGCCPGEWITPTLETPWETDDACPFQYRWGPHRDGATLEVAGLEFSGKVFGGDSESVVFTLPVEDRPSCPLDGEALVLDEDDVPVNVFAYHIATSGEVTVVFPLIEVGDVEVIAADVSYAGASGISATDVEGALDELAAEKTDLTTFNAHHTRHELGGADAIKLDDLAAPDDNTDLNASTSKHGLLRKLSGTATEYLDGSGAWSTPAGGGGGGGGVGVTEEKAHVEITADVTVTATTEGSPTTVVAMTSDLTVNGSTPLMVEVFARGHGPPNVAAGAYLILNLHVSTNSGGSWTDLGRIASTQTPSTGQLVVPLEGRRRLTPAAGTVRYRIVAWGSASGGVVQAGAGGAGVAVPAFLRVTAATILGGLVLIEDKLLVASAASFDFTSIPATYKHLKLIVQARSTLAGATNDWLTLRANGDTGANYEIMHHQVFGVTNGLTESLTPTNLAWLSELPAANSPAGAPGSIDLEIPSYAGTTFWKTFHSTGGTIMQTSTGQIRHIEFYGVWKATSAINRLTLAPTGGQLAAGSRATLYGYA